MMRAQRKWSMVVVWEAAALLQSVTAPTVVMFPMDRIQVDNVGGQSAWGGLSSVQVEASGAEGQKWIPWDTEEITNDQLDQKWVCDTQQQQWQCWWQDLQNHPNTSQERKNQVYTSAKSKTSPQQPASVKREFFCPLPSPSSLHSSFSEL